MRMKVKVNNVCWSLVLVPSVGPIPASTLVYFSYIRLIPPPFAKVYLTKEHLRVLARGKKRLDILFENKITCVIER